MSLSSSLSTSTLVGFLCVRDRQQAKAFYTGTLGLEIALEDQFALVLVAGQTRLRISEMKDFQPQPFTVVGWEVTDINSTVESLTARGVEFQRFDGLEQDELGIWLSPTTEARIAWFKDPDGNLLGLSQHPESSD